MTMIQAAKPMKTNAHTHISNGSEGFLIDFVWKKESQWWGYDASFRKIVSRIVSNETIKRIHQQHRLLLRIIVMFPWICCCLYRMCFFVIVSTTCIPHYISNARCQCYCTIYFPFVSPFILWIAVAIWFVIFKFIPISSINIPKREKWISALL